MSEPSTYREWLRAYAAESGLDLDTASERDRRVLEDTALAAAVRFRYAAIDLGRALADALRPVLEHLTR